MLFDLTESLSPLERWRRKIMADHDVSTHCAPAMAMLNDPWTAFIGSWEHLSEYVGVMESRNELRHGKTEREALESLARANGWPTLEEEQYQQQIPQPSA